MTDWLERLQGILAPRLERLEAKLEALDDKMARNEDQTRRLGRAVQRLQLESTRQQARMDSLKDETREHVVNYILTQQIESLKSQVGGQLPPGSSGDET